MPMIPDYYQAESLLQASMEGMILRMRGFYLLQARKVVIEYCVCWYCCLQ